MSWRLAGRYLIESEIGRGAMGVVYCAYDEMLDRRIAVKELMLPPGLAPDVREDLSSRFSREARLTARLSHPNVVQVFDVLSEGDRSFIAMELLEGATLAALMGGSPMDEGRTVTIVSQVLEGVGAAHSAGIVHRDMKPDNVFVLNDGRVKVGDFGIARAMDAPAGSHATQFGTILGTPGYMAPEQVAGGQVDARADLFSIGVIAYEMLSGANPFDAPTVPAALYRVVNEHPPALADRGVSHEMSTAIQRAMAKSPADRFNSAQEMNAALGGGWSTVGNAQTLPGLAPVSLAPAGSSSSAIVGVVAAVLGLALVAVLALAGGSGTLGGGGARDDSAVTGVGDAGATEVETPAQTSPLIVVTLNRLPDPAVAGDEVKVRAQLTGDAEVAKAHLLVNGTPVGSVLAAAPWEWTWTPPSAEEYEVAVSAETLDGEEFHSETAQLVVAAPRTPGGSGAGSAPSTDGSFWTAIAGSTASEDDAVRVAESIVSAGLEADVLVSDEYERLRPGYWVAYSGVFDSKAEAEDRVGELEALGMDAYVRFTGTCLVGE